MGSLAVWARPDQTDRIGLRAKPALSRRGLKRNESRDVAVYLARVHSGRKLEELGDHFGGISGAAVSHACRRMEAKLRSSRAFRKQVGDLAGRLQEGRGRESTSNGEY